MPGYNEISEKYRDAEGRILNRYRKDASWLRFEEAEIKGVFSEEELDLLVELAEDMEKASGENQRKALLINKIDRYAGVIEKLLRLAGMP